MTDLNLEQAQHHYGRSLVPWVLDNRDLKIINKTRAEYMKENGSLIKPSSHLSEFFLGKSLERVIQERLWFAAQKEI